jgi:hypothetical protein
MYKSDKELLGEFFNLRSILVSKVISKIEDPSAPAMRAPMYKIDKELLGEFFTFRSILVSQGIPYRRPHLVLRFGNIL